MTNSPATYEDRMRVRKRRTFQVASKDRSAFDWLINHCERAYVVHDKNDEFLADRPHPASKEGRDLLFDHRAMTMEDWATHLRSNGPFTEIRLVKDGSIAGVSELVPILSATFIISNYLDCFSGRVLSLAKRVTDADAGIGFQIVFPRLSFSDQYSGSIRMNKFASEDNTLRLFDTVETQYVAGRKTPSSLSPL